MHILLYVCACIEREREFVNVCIYIHAYSTVCVYMHREREFRVQVLYIALLQIQQAQSPCVSMAGRSSPGSEALWLLAGTSTMTPSRPVSFLSSSLILSAVILRTISSAAAMPRALILTSTRTVEFLPLVMLSILSIVTSLYETPATLARDALSAVCLSAVKLAFDMGRDKVIFTTIAVARPNIEVLLWLMSSKHTKQNIQTHQ